MLLAMGLLAAAILFGGLMPTYQLNLIMPIGNQLAANAGLVPAMVPDLVMQWPLSAGLVMIGAILVLFTGRFSVVWAGRLAVVTLLLAIAAIQYEADRYDLLSFYFALLIAGVGALNMLPYHSLSRSQSCPAALLCRLSGDDRWFVGHDRSC